jgi:hypothetical protein
MYNTGSLNAGHLHRIKTSIWICDKICIDSRIHDIFVINGKPSKAPAASNTSKEKKNSAISSSMTDM